MRPKGRLGNVVLLFASDLLIAIPGNPPSGGEHIEIGHATAQEKPIIQFRKENGEYTPLLDGLGTKTKVAYLCYKHSIREVLPNIHMLIQSILAQ